MNTINWEEELDYEKILEDETKKVEQDKADSEANINKVYDSQKTVANDAYGRAVDDTESQYTDLYQKNAVQKLINEQQVAESMANIGLTDSGLNRTQQTAVQLSYANQKGKLDINRQKALEELSATLASDIATIEQKRIADLDSNEKYWKGLAEKNAQERYKTNVDSYTEIQKEAFNAAANASKNSSKPSVSYGAGGTMSGGYIVSSETGTLARDYSGSLKSNGVSTVYHYNDDGTIKFVTYADANSGISADFDAGVNPYTGRMHDDLRDKEGKYDPSKAFDNGYQPNNINGTPLIATGETWIFYDREQKVFELGSTGEYYVWRADLGRYKKLTVDEASKVGL